MSQKELDPCDHPKPEWDWEQYKKQGQYPPAQVVIQAALWHIDHHGKVLVYDETKGHFAEESRFYKVDLDNLYPDDYGEELLRVARSVYRAVTCLRQAPPIWYPTIIEELAVQLTPYWKCEAFLEQVSRPDFYKRDKEYLLEPNWHDVEDVLGTKFLYGYDW